ncbi:hypothetical protein CROQUDRAFT_54546 [Cronartium quercuum f. sp. fusiforme G11]|uniref:Polysaccharide lyase 14 domain-containing protein n=1 Tax=Cronartium quercuum f. sp. fusiforme G11 TaxID=708437 RepID=A0A9P6T6L9_9BASI|nr:hypothetical protein CROQUDRAFT_54546 [Cronartium quercuum f. sp. fusiforme G11]
MGRTGQTSSTLSPEQIVVILLRSIQLVQSVPTPTLRPLYLSPARVSPLQIASTPLPPTPATLTEIQYVTVPTTVTVQVAATTVAGSPSFPTPSPSSTLPPSHPNLNPNKWETRKNFTFSDFGIQHWNWGKNDNVDLLPALPVPPALQSTGRETFNDGSVIQVRYPLGSINPANKNAPQGGMGFYASPLNISHATNVTFSYSVFFPKDFQFVKGGKLPGLYGGKTGCSGGVNSDNCFSTRLMFRERGMGELYLYAPKNKQGPNVCKTPPTSYCNGEYGYSIGRGAWNFTPGAWTDVRQDIWLNTNGLPNGGFNVWVNGKLVMSANDAYYRNDEKSPTKDQTKPTYANLPAMTTPIPAPILLAISAANVVPGAVEDIVPASPTGILDNLIMRRHDAHSHPHSRTKSVQAHSNVGLRVRKILDEKFNKRTFQSYNDTSNSIINSQNLGPFPGMGYGPGYTTTLSANPITYTTGASPEEYSVPRNLTMGTSIGSMILPTSIPKIDHQTPPQTNSTKVTTTTTKNQVFSKKINKKKKKVVISSSVNFIGIMAETFFGGHDSSWASPKDQFSYFNSFKILIN